MTSFECRLEKVLVGLLLRNPFYSHLLSRIPRRPTREVPTLAVSVAGTLPALLINPDFFFDPGKTDQQRIGMLKHELLHIVLKHPFRRPINGDQLIWNIACDVAVNGMIPAEELPADAVDGRSFGLTTNDASAELLYSQLQSRMEAPEPVQGHQFWSTTTEGAGADYTTERFIDQAIAQSWKKTPTSSRQEMPNVVRRIAEEIGGRLVPVVEWRRQLRLFASACTRTCLRNTTRKPSRRFATIPGVKVKFDVRLAVAVDTSASIDDTSIEEFFEQIHAICMNRVKVTVIECDTCIRRVYPYDEASPIEVHGRGGTLFEPVFSWIATQRRERFAGLVYFTDGYAKPPVTKPYCRMMWVLTRESCPADHNLPFGPMIQIQ